MSQVVEATNCHQCGGFIRDYRVTLPRAKTGDLAFCRWICLERWRGRR